MSKLPDAMAASTKRPCRSSWQNLAQDLLRDVLSRLPSLADRVRLRAVCRTWRTAAMPQPGGPPQLPWLALPDGSVLDFANNSRHRLSIPNDDGPCYSAGENMFFLHHNDGRCSVVNGFSGAATPLPELASLLQSHMVNPFDERKVEKFDHRLKFDRKSYENMKIKKVAMASSTDHDRVVAVLASDPYKSKVFISTCRPAGEINSCVVMREISTILDIAFFQGKMYAHVRMFQELVAVDLSDGCLDKPTPAGVEPQAKAYTSWIWPPDLLPDMYLEDLFDDPKPDEQVEQYLVESNGKLLMVKRGFRQLGRNQATSRFRVFEADLTDGPRLGRWKKARSLHGRALFVGTPCSKSFRACDVDGARGDCIYFVIDCDSPLRTSAVHNMVDKTTVRLMPCSVWRGVKLTWNSGRFPAWFFPVEV